MAASSRSLTALLGFWLAAAGLVAQSRTAGRVVRVAGSDTVAVTGAAVVLHRVGRSAQGPLDTTAVDRAGRFAFRFAGDSTASYLLSVRYAGIEYFSSIIATNPARPDTAVVIVVADTSSTIRVTTRERTLLISAPDESRSRAVVDWFVLQNATQQTRVSPDSLRPGWGAPLPPDAQNVELADLRLSQFSPEALEFRHDSVLVFAPLSPGQKELVLQYRLPSELRRFQAPNAAGTDSVFVLLEEPRARVVAPPMTVSDSQRLEGRLFRRWAGVMAAGATIEVSFPSPGLAPGLVLKLLVAVAGLGFAALAVVTVRRRRRLPARLPAPSPEWLADAIARLDLDLEERVDTLSAEERAACLAERARLHAALNQALAGTRQGS